MSSSIALSAEELWTIFDSLDADKNGVLDLAELTQAMKKLQMPIDDATCRNVLLEADTDHDGTISFDEFVIIVRKREALIKDLFDKLDSDHNGVLGVKEVQEGLKKSMNIQLSDGEIQKLFSKINRSATSPASFTASDFNRALILFPAHTQKELVQMWCQNSALSYLMYNDVPTQPAPFHTLTAGFIAGAVSRTITAPFDRVSLCLRAGGTQHAGKGVFGAMKSMAQAGGLKSLWGGNGVNVLQVGPESALTFFFYEAFKAAFLKDPQHPSAAEKFTFGAAAGASAMTAVYPMYVVQARMAVAEPGVFKGMFDCFIQTYVREGGVSALFKGYIPSFLRIIPYKGGDLLIFNTLKEIFVAPEATPSAFQCMAFGAAASACSQTLTYPLVTARTKLQAQGNASGRPILYTGTWDALVKTVNGSTKLGLQAEGLAGLYRGCIANLMKMVPAVALQFTVYEKMMKLLQTKKW